MYRARGRNRDFDLNFLKLKGLAPDSVVTSNSQMCGEQGFLFGRWPNNMTAEEAGEA